MILEILKYGYMVLVAGAQVFFVGIFLLGFWNGFTYEAGKKGSKFHFWFTLLPFKRFFNRRKISQNQVIEYFIGLKEVFADLSSKFEKEDKYREKLKCDTQIHDINAIIEYVKKWKENE